MSTATHTPKPGSFLARCAEMKAAAAAALAESGADADYRELMEAEAADNDDRNDYLTDGGSI